MKKMGLPLVIGSWLAQVVAAFIVGQTLFYKLTGAPETVALFQVVGGEPFTRYATAAAELVAVVLILIPRTASVGGLAVVGVMSGAMMAHFTKLGISIDPVALGNENLQELAGPTLFIMGVVAWLCGAAVLFIRRAQLPIIGPRLATPTVRPQPAPAKSDQPA